MRWPGTRSDCLAVLIPCLVLAAGCGSKSFTDLRTPIFTGNCNVAVDCQQDSPLAYEARGESARDVVIERDEDNCVSATIRGMGHGPREVDFTFGGKSLERLTLSRGAHGTVTKVDQAKLAFHVFDKSVLTVSGTVEELNISAQGPCRIDLRQLVAGDTLLVLSMGATAVLGPCKRIDGWVKKGSSLTCIVKPGSGAPRVDDSSTYVIEPSSKSP